MSDAAIVMVGTDLEGRGGMSSVVATYRDSGLFERCGVLYLRSHVDGAPSAKLKVLAIALWRLWALLFEGRVRLVHIHAASGTSFWRKSIFFWSARLWRRPVLLHIHGGEFDRFASSRGPIGRALLRATFGSARRVVVVSRIWLERLLPICPAAKWITIDNPVVLRPPPEHSPPPDGLVRVLFLGRLERTKGVFELIRAVASVHKRLPQLRLVLAGEGDRDQVERLVHELGVDGCVELVGWVSGRAKEEWLDRCQIFALPSYVEALPVSMLEAMAAGSAVIVSSVGSVPEVITHRQNGWLVAAHAVEPIAAALLELVNDVDLRVRLGAAGRRLVESRFAATSVCLELERLYSSVSCEGAEVD